MKKLIKGAIWVIVIGTLYFGVHYIISLIRGVK